MTQQKDKKRNTTPEDSEFIDLFYQLPEDIRLETLTILIKLMHCYLKDDPAVALTYHDGFMHIHGYNISVKDAKEIIMQLGQAFIVDKLLEKTDTTGAKH